MTAHYNAPNALLLLSDDISTRSDAQSPEISFHLQSQSSAFRFTKHRACATADSILAGDAWSFSYLPGAGDDEESWARRLTPDLLWQHREALVSAGPAGVQLLVSQLTRGVAPGALIRIYLLQLLSSASNYEAPHSLLWAGTTGVDVFKMHGRSHLSAGPQSSPLWRT